MLLWLELIFLELEFPVAALDKGGLRQKKDKVIEL